MHRHRGDGRARRLGVVLIVGMALTTVGSAAGADPTADTRTSVGLANAGLAWSSYVQAPDGRHASGWHLQPVGGTPRPVTVDVPDAAEIRFAPDGTKVAFTGTTSDGYRALWIADANGERAYQMTDLHWSVSNPRWSHNGHFIVFQRGDGKPYSMPAQPGAVPEELWDITPSPISGGYDEFDYDVHLDQLFTGMVFANVDEWGQGHPGYYLPNIVSEVGMKKLADDVYVPTLSPNGKRIAWAHNNVITLYTIETEKQTRLQVPDGEIFDLEWSPDGRQLAFSHSEGNQDKAILSLTVADGSVRTVAEPDPDIRGDVTWQDNVTGDLTRVQGAGDDPITTSLAVEALRIPGSHTGSVLVGENAPFDTAGAAVLADAIDGPVFTNPKSELDPRIAEALVDADPDTSSPVYLAGGKAALSQAVADDVRALGFEVVRAGSNDELATSLRLAEFTDTADESRWPGSGSYGVVLVGADEDWRTLAAAASARSVRATALLRVPTTDPAGDDPALAFVRDEALDDDDIIAVGETATEWAVAGHVQLDGRVDVGNPAETAVRLAERFGVRSAPDGATVASSDNSTASALTPVLALTQGTPLLFTEHDALPTATATYLDQRSVTLESAHVLGSAALVADPVVTRIGELIATNVRVTDR